MYENLGVLSLGKYELTLNAMRDPTAPWIIIDSTNKNHRFLRALVECLVHFAANTTTSGIKLLSFSNRAYPIKVLSQDKAKELLSEWLDEFSQINIRPSSLVSPLAIAHAEAFIAGKQNQFRVNWYDKSLVHSLEYRRLLSGNPSVHKEYSQLIRRLVATLVKQRGAGSANF